MKQLPETPTEDAWDETMVSSGYSSFLAEVNDLAKLNKSSGEQLVTQIENEPLRKVPKLSDNKKFLGRLRATRLLIYKATYHEFKGE